MFSLIVNTLTFISVCCYTELVRSLLGTLFYVNASLKLCFYCRVVLFIVNDESFGPTKTQVAIVKHLSMSGKVIRKSVDEHVAEFPDDSI